MRQTAEQITLALLNRGFKEYKNLEQDWVCPYCDVMYQLIIDDMHITYYYQAGHTLGYNVKLGATIMLEVTDTGNQTQIFVYRLQDIDMPVIDIETEAVLAYQALMKCMNKHRNKAR